MTGKELILYILENNLENEEIFKDGKLLGFMTVEEVAIKYGYGIESTKLWAKLNGAKVIKVGDETYILGDPSKWE